ncbi:polysaccharide biosynthesis C-terminal domain-containing protein [Fructilactobacillus frigidiflavus]|uniref:oligosaccharide flippase family protein n=1 Tax=Fructilactobacillus frigidiflavus TaxID=3242688 RepID=UPI0037569138
MKVIKNYLYNMSYQIFILIVPLLTTPYLARVLEPKGIGIVTFTNSITQYFIIFGSIGVSLYGSRQIAFVREDKMKLSKTFYDIFFLRLITIFLSLILFFIFLSFLHKYKQFYIVQSFSIIAAAFDISWFFQGIENFKVTVLRNFIIKVITIVSIFTLVKTSNDLALYIFIISISLLIGNLSLFPYLKNNIEKPQWNNINLIIPFKGAMIFFIPEVATQIYLYVNKTMLGIITNPTISGYFEQSDKIIKMSLAVVTSIGMVMLPHVANAHKQGNHQRVKNYLYKTFEFVTMLSIPLAFGISAIASNLVYLYLSDKFLQVIPILMIESIVIILIAWSNAIGIQYLMPTEQNKVFNYSVILGAIINIILNFPLIILWGAIGTAISTIISELAVTIYQIWSIREQINLKNLFSDFYKYMFSGILMFLIVFIINKNYVPTWTHLMIEITIGMISYSVLLLILKPNLIKIILDNSKNFLKNKFS